MRTTLAPFVALLLPLLAVFLPGCRPPNPESGQGVQLSLTTAELRPDSSFELNFEEPMVPFEAVGQTSSVPVLRIDPPVPGHFVWRTRRSGIFTPGEPFALGAPLRFSLAPSLTNLAGKPTGARLQRVVEGPQLQLGLSTFEYWPEHEMPPFPPVHLEFNAPVSAARIARHARYTDGQSVVGVDVTEIEPSMILADSALPRSLVNPITWRERFRAAREEFASVLPLTPEALLTNRWYERGARFVVRPQRPLVSTNIWRLEIEPGLEASQDPIALRSPATQILGISPHFELTEAETENTPRRGRAVRLRFSRAVDPGIATNDPARWFSLSPPTPDLKAEPGYSGRTLVLHGNFDLGTKYTLILRTNLPSASGLPLQPTDSLEFEFEPIRPTVWLGAFDTIQLAHGHRELGLLGINATDVRLRIKRLNRHTLIHAIQAYQRYLRGGSPFNRDALPASPLDYAGIPGQTVLDTNFPLTASIDLPATRTFDWGQILPGQPAGSFFLEADLHGLPESDSPSGTRIGPQSIVQLTDLGLVAKVGRTETRVWVFSHHTGQPVADARVFLCTHENVFLQEAVTDSTGMVRIPNTPSGSWVLVEKGEDLHAHPLDESSVPLWGFGIHHSDAPTEGNRLFAFTDREAYRPGEELHLRLLARTQSDAGWNFPTNSEVQLEVLSPREDVVLRTNLPLSPTGDAQWTWRVPQATRGTYTLNLAASGATTSLRAEVRDFQPAAFEVSLDAPHNLAPGQPIAVPVRARYLFGQPLARANVTWSAEATDVTFAPEGWESFSFGAHDSHHHDAEPPESPGHSTLTGKSLLLDSAPLVLSPDLPRNPIEPGPQAIEIVTEVTDLNQQTIVQSAGFTRDSSAFYLGFRWADGPEAIFATNAPLHGHVVAVRTDGQPWTAPSTIEARLFRVRWKSVATVRAGQTIGYTSHVELEPAGQFSLPPHPVVKEGDDWSVANGAPPLTIPPLPEPGAYQLELRTSDPEGRPILTSTVFHVSGDARVTWHNRNGLSLAMVPDRKSHQPGDTAAYLLKTPFSGTAWVTVERENVLLSFVTNLTGNAPALRIPVVASNSPNAFVGVTLVRGTATSPHQHPMPEWRIGYHELSVPDDSHRLQVQVAAPTNALLPGAPVEVSILVSDSTLRPVPDAPITVYAVDEGYLQLKGTQVPDPSKAFEIQRPLEVSTTLSLPLLLEEDPLRRQFANKGYIAGGGGRFAQNRRKFIPCPLWDTTLRTDASGRATIRFTAPDSLTRYRIVAVATHGPARMGSGSTAVEIRKPLMIESALPRFAHVGDLLSARALVFNTSPSNLTVHVRCIPGANARFEPTSPGTRDLSIAPGGIEVVEFPVQLTEPGHPTWVWSAETSDTGVRDAVEIELPVTHAEPAAHGVVQKEVPASGAALLQDIEPALLEAPESVTVRIAANPLALVGEGTRQLVHYPYGCVEQTGSSILPWIALRDHPMLLPRGPELPTNALTAIQAGVQRFWTMQTRDGGLGYWPGAQQPQRWGSAYAAWILSLASRAGAQVDSNRVARLHTWLNKQWKQESAPYSPAQLHERCLTAFALASAGAAESSLHDSLVDQVDLLPIEDRSLLILALLQSETPRERIRLLIEAPAPKSSGSSQFGNEARSLAIQLLALHHFDPARPERQQLTQRLAATQRHGHWNTTQGNAWALWALAEVSRASNHASAIHGEIQFHDRKVAFDLTAAAPIALIALPLTTNDAALRLSHSSTAPILVQVDVTARAPVSPLPSQPIERGFRIQRTFSKLDPENHELPASNLQVGDRVLVTLTVDAPDSAEWVAIEDPIPAILEPVQGVFRSAIPQPLPSWNVDFQEVRADRMLFFSDQFPEGRHTIRYLARVRAAGNAVAAPCRVEAMYRPEQNALSDSTRLQAIPASR